MTSRRYITYLCGASVAVLSAVTFDIHTAHAQQTPGASGGGVEEVVVTARRRDESQQRVPVAVTAISGKQLETQSVRGIEDVAKIAPGLTISPVGRGGSVANVSMRGQENTGLALTNDPAVGIYFDEVYLGRSAGNLLASLQDMSSVQVLRGPQGTLFGRNNTGGAVLLTSNRPSLHGFGGEAMVKAGSFGQLEYGAIADATVVDGILGIRLSWKKTEQDGVGRSIVTGIDSWGDRDRQSGRISVRLRPIEPLTFDLTYDFADIDETGQNTVSVLTLSGLDFFESRAGILDPLSTAWVTGYTFRSTYEVNPDLTLKAIVGRRSVATKLQNDVDASPATFLDVIQFMHQDQWSGELQASGTILRDAASWLKEVTFTTGGYYFWESGGDGSALPLPLPSNIYSAGRYLNNDATNTSTAGYAQFETNTADKLFLTFGARYTKDKRELSVQALGGGFCTLSVLTPTTPLNQCMQSNAASFGYWSYSTGARFQFNDNLNVYVKYDKGQRAGGLDDSPASIDPYEPEVVNSFEVGVKADWLDGRLRTNLALYHSKVDNVQRATLLSDANGNPYNSIINVARARVRGIEAEATAVPFTGLTLSGSLGITDAKYLEWRDLRPGPTLGSDLTHLTYPYTPKVTYTLAANYEIPVDTLGALIFRVDYAHRSKVFFDTFNNALAVQDAYGTVNARIQFDFDQTPIGEQVSLAVYGRNITDERYNIGGASTAGGLLTRTDDREAYGVELRVRF